MLHTIDLLALAALHETSGAGGFGSGFLHPLTGADHALAMIAVGLWGAQLGKPAVALLPVAFPLAMTLGAFVGFSGVELGAVEICIALSAILLGLVVMLETRPPLWLALLLVAGFAIFHGYAHGTELPEGEDGLRYSIGFVLSTGLLHAVGITLGLVHRHAWGRKLMRGLGGGVCIAGCWFLWSALR
ncbi:MAG: HupE/UreJ family protein [Planctomycetes bacterium]|nr:HupE/UreJ family protein [Planctomycetota bacterium]MCB9903031.1 HupE/UreJ family protein [Planctomycetota bacterium]